MRKKEKNKNIIRHLNPADVGFLLFLLSIGIACYVVYKNGKKSVIKIPSKEFPIIIPTKAPEEVKKIEKIVSNLDKTLKLEDFVGQEKAKEYLRFHLDYCKLNNKPFPHIVLYGHGGLGKSTLIKAIAKELGSNFIEVTPAIISSSQMMMGVFFDKVCKSCGEQNIFNTKKCRSCNADLSQDFDVKPKVKYKDIIFLEECHSLATNIEEALYSVMQDGYMMIRTSGNIIEKELPKLTIAGATTKLGNLNEPFRQRFNLAIKLEPYDSKEIYTILKQFCKVNNININKEVIENVSKISHGIPRIGKALINDLKVMNDVLVTQEHFTKLVDIKELDDIGLDPTQLKIIKFLLDREKAGAGAIATFCGLTQYEYEEVHEPILLYHSLVSLTSRGRILTDKAKNKYGYLK